MTQANGARAAAARNDETARLYGKYARQLYRYCLARLRSPEEAEDAVQNTFVRVHGALARGATPRFEAAWLYKIAHNVCLTRIETRSRRAEHELAGLDGIDVAAPETPREALLGLEAALASMPKNLRDAILLREWQGLTYAEIADSLDTSVPAVETLIFRARRHLASALQPAGAAVVDAGTLYGALRVLLARLRSALGTLGPAKLAAGVAAATLGTAGVAAVADLEAHPPGHDPAPTATVRGAVPAADTTQAPTPARVAPRRVTRPRGAKPRTAPLHVASAAPVRAAAPIPAPTTAAMPAPPAVPAAAPAAAPAPAPTTTAAAPLPALPTATAPRLTVPTLTVPTLQTPTVPVVPTVPAPTTPELPVTVSVPTVTLPALP